MSENNEQKVRFKFPLWWLIIALVAFWFLFVYAQQCGSKSYIIIPYSHFLQLADEKKIVEATIRGQAVDGKLSVSLNEKGEEVLPEQAKKGGKIFKEVETTIPEGGGAGLAKKLAESGAKVIVVEQTGGSIWSNIIWMVILVALAIWFFRRMGKTMGGQQDFLSKFTHAGKEYDQKQKKVTYADVAGCEEAKERLKEVIDFLKNPKDFSRLGARPPKGVLLMGPPGTGKTLLAKATASEAGVPFISMTGSGFVEMFVGVGAARVRSLFDRARKSAPCIVFIDEIDAVGRERGAGVGHGNDEREQTLNEILNEMDGFDGREGIVVVAATNRPDILDPGIIRPGRFDRKLVVPRPDVNGRKAIFDVHLRRVKHNLSEKDVENLARITPGLTGADIENFVNEAALLATRTDKEVISANDVDEAIKEVSMGPVLRHHIITEREKNIAAVHEAGHAIVAELVGENVCDVSILPRGTAGGVTRTMPSEDIGIYSENMCRAKLAVAVAGRVAEEIIFNEKTTGAESDIDQATNLARKMVTSWGMSEKLGMVALGSVREHPFLGMEIGDGKSISEDTSKLIDGEIRGLINRAIAEARKAILSNKKAFDELVKALREFETLSGERVRKIIAENPSSD